MQQIYISGRSVFINAEGESNPISTPGRLHGNLKLHDEKSEAPILNDLLRVKH